MTQIGVHRTHCCKSHGCKYAYTKAEMDACPVVTGEVKQAHLCERCDEIIYDLRETIAFVPATIRFVEKWPLMDRWVINTPNGERHLDFRTDDRVGMVFMDTGTYTVDQLTWIAAKAQLLQMETVQR